MCPIVAFRLAKVVKRIKLYNSCHNCLIRQVLSYSSTLMHFYFTLQQIRNGIENVGLVGNNLRILALHHSLFISISPLMFVSCMPNIHNFMLHFAKYSLVLNHLCKWHISQCLEITFTWNDCTVDWIHQTRFGCKFQLTYVKRVEKPIKSTLCDWFANSDHCLVFGTNFWGLIHHCGLVVVVVVTIVLFIWLIYCFHAFCTNNSSGKLFDLESKSLCN